MKLLFNFSVEILLDKRYPTLRGFGLRPMLLQKVEQNWVFNLRSALFTQKCCRVWACRKNNKKKVKNVDIIFMINRVVDLPSSAKDRIGSGAGDCNRFPISSNNSILYQFAIDATLHLVP